MIHQQRFASTILTALLNQAWTLSGTTYTNPTDLVLRPKTVYLALFTTMPTVSGTGIPVSYVEPSGGNYARVLLTANGLGGNKLLSPVEYVLKDGVRTASISNKTEQIMFPYTGETGSGYDAPVVGFGILDAATGGNVVLYGTLDAPVTIGANVIPIILAGGLEFTLV